MDAIAQSSSEKREPWAPLATFRKTTIAAVDLQRINRQPFFSLPPPACLLTPIQSSLRQHQQFRFKFNQVCPHQLKFVIQTNVKIVHRIASLPRMDGKWWEYLSENGLIDCSELRQTPKPFPLSGQRLREYRKSMEKLVDNFKTEVISGFDMNAVCRDSVKRQPAESKQNAYEERNEPTLRVIDSANTIIRDGTTTR